MACERYEAAVKAAPRRRLDPLGNRLLILQWSSPPYAMARICHFCIFMHNSTATWQESGLSVGANPPSCYRNTGFLPIRAVQGARRLQESPILAIEHPLRHVHIQKGLFLATERYSVLNYVARFALPSRCRAFARRYEVGLRGLSLVLFNAFCSVSFAYQNITTFGVCPVQVAHPLWGYAACRRICSLAGSKTETWLTSSNV